MKKCEEFDRLRRALDDKPDLHADLKAVFNRGITMTDRVRIFHKKHGFCVDTSLLDPYGGPGELQAQAEHAGTNQLLMAARVLRTLSEQWQRGTCHPDVPCGPLTYDNRLMRSHLMLEELAESLEAMAVRDETKLLDGLADLDYVTHGTAVSYGLPLDEAAVTVHESNMTKAVRSADKDADPRLRNKGVSYVPPDLAQVLADHRTEQGVSVTENGWHNTKSEGGPYRTMQEALKQ